MNTNEPAHPVGPSAPPPMPPPRRRTEPPSRLAEAFRHAPVSSVLITLNFIIALAMWLTGVNVLLPDPADVFAWGGDFGLYTLDGQHWRMLTAIFLHYGILHLGFNMWALRCSGPLLEQLIGSAAMLMVYVFAGLVASLASLMHNPLAVGAGASGAIFGVFGCIAAYIGVNRHAIRPEARRGMMRWIWLIILPNLALGFTSDFIDNSAHFGGFAAGMLAGAMLGFRNPQRRTHVQRAGAFALLSITVTVFLLVRLGNPYREYFQSIQLYVRGDVEQATANLTRLTQRLPQWPRPWSTLADIAEAQGDLALAAQHYKHAYQLDPSDPDFGIDYAEFMARSGRHDEARILLDMLRPEHGDYPRLLYADALLAATAEKNDKTALAALDHALQTDPENVECLALRAILHLRAGATAPAEADLLALKQSPEAELGWRQLGEDAAEYSDHALAIAAYDQALAMIPDDAWSFHKRAFSHFALGNDQAAESDWRQAAAFTEGDTDKAGSLENVGLIYLRRGDWQGALTLTDEVNALDATLTWNALARAVAADKLGQRPLAEQAHAQWIAQRTAHDLAELRRLLPSKLHAYLETLPAS